MKQVWSPTTMTTFKDELVERCRTVPLHLIVGNPKVNRKVKILCPFHAEHTASMVIFPTGGYKCYGCPAHGNSIDFLTNLGASFDEAINDLKIYI